MRAISAVNMVTGNESAPRNHTRLANPTLPAILTSPMFSGPYAQQLVSSEGKKCGPGGEKEDEVAGSVHVPTIGEREGGMWTFNAWGVMFSCLATKAVCILTCPGYSTATFSFTYCGGGGSVHVPG